MLVADPHRELTVEDVEPLVLLVVDVPRRAFALPNGHLDQPVFAAGVGAADLDDLEHPEQPVRLTLVRTEQIPVLRAFGGNHSHLTCSLPWSFVQFSTVRLRTVRSRTISGRTTDVKPNS